MTEQERIRQIFLKTRDEAHRLVAEYGASQDVLETRHLEKLDAINDAPTPKEALDRSELALTSVHTTLLSLLSRGKIPGRNPSAAFEKQARKAMSRAKMFDKKAESKFSTAQEAESFRKKAEKERVKAAELYQKAGITPPQEVVLSDEEMAEAEDEIKKKPTRARAS